MERFDSHWDDEALTRPEIPVEGEFRFPRLTAETFCEKECGSVTTSILFLPVLTAADRGISIKRMTVGGYPPPQNSGTTGRSFKIQTAFDRCGKFVEENLMLLTSGH